MKNFNQNPKKILFSVGVDRLESKFRKLSSPLFREYALFYDFEYHEITEYLPLNRKPHWIKIDYILKLMNLLNYGDLIAFLDADIAIFRGDIELTTSAFYKYSTFVGNDLIIYHPKLEVISQWIS